ncbi:MAG: alpha/beta hydrolase [Hymenobacter sp.]
MPAGFVSGYREINHVRLHYVTGGRGPLLVLVHGFGQSWYEWHQLMPLLARHFTVVAPDLPGLGESAVPASYAGRTWRNISTGWLKASRPAPSSTSWRTISASGTPIRWPWRRPTLSRLVYLLNPHSDSSLYSFPAFTPAGKAWSGTSAFFGHRPTAETLLKGHELFFLTHFILTHATNKAAFTPELLAMYGRSYARPGVLHASCEYYRALNETVRRNVPLAGTKLQMPVLILGGVGTAAWANLRVKQIKSYADHVESHILPNGGHWLGRVSHRSQPVCGRVSDPESG